MSALTKDRLVNLLTDTGLVDKAALLDPEGYDHGQTRSFVMSFCDKVLRESAPSATMATEERERLIRQAHNYAEQEEKHGIPMAGATAVAQEPVAWMRADGKVCTTTERIERSLKHEYWGRFDIPLYAAPQPVLMEVMRTISPESEEFTHVLRYEMTIHDRTKEVFVMTDTGELYAFKVPPVPSPSRNNGEGGGT